MKQRTLDGLLLKRPVEGKPHLTLPAPAGRRRSVDIEDADVIAIESGSLATTEHSGERMDEDGVDERAPPGDRGSSAPAASNGPARHEDYAGWLAARKQLWRAEREERKRRRLTAAAPAPARAAGVAGMLAERAVLSSSHWQIVALDATRQPGVLRCWALVDGRMRGVDLRVPRTLYANVLAPPSHPLVPELGVCVRRVLPRGQVPATLVQIALDEAAFHDQLPDLNERLLSLGLVGVYEDRLRLDYSAALQVSLGGGMRTRVERRNENLLVCMKWALVLQELDSRASPSSSHGMPSSAPINFYTILFTHRLDAWRRRRTAAP